MEIEKIKLVFNSLYAVQKTLEREKGKEVGELTKLIAKYLGESDFCKTLEDIYPLWKKYEQRGDILSDEFWDEIQKETQAIWTKHKQSQMSLKICSYILEEFDKKAKKRRSSNE